VSAEPVSLQRSSGRTYLFPYQISKEAESYATFLTKEELTISGHFVVYGGSGIVKSWQKWLSPRPELADWTSNSIGKFGTVAAIEFSSPRLLEAHWIEPMKWVDGP
jgi:hypothetical protein